MNGKKFYRLFLWAIILIVTFLPDAILAAEKELTVAVAANVQFAMDDLKKEFQKKTGTKIRTVTGSSGKLTSQIKNGAPFDIFLSADLTYPERLYKDGLTISKPVVYAYGTLVLWTFKEDINLKESLESLLGKAAKLAVANPRVAPYGEETIKVINSLKNAAAIKENIIYGESVSQVNTYITSRTVTFGFTSKSSVMLPKMKNKGKWVEINKNSYSPIPQAAVIIKKSRNLKAAESFYRFIFSAEGRKIFEKHGYLLPAK